MLRTPLFLGFSMVRKESRRRLVVFTYLILLASMVLMVVVFPSARAFGIVWCLILAYSAVSWLVFGRLANDMVLAQMHGSLVTSLGLTPSAHRSEDELDEREVAVRNAAYFTAYRAVAVYSIVAWIVLICSFDVGASTALLLARWLSSPLLAMILTLPPAVILWREPDVPEEARA